MGIAYLRAYVLRRKYQALSEHDPSRVVLLPAYNPEQALMESRPITSGIEKIMFLGSPAPQPRPCHEPTLRRVSPVAVGAGTEPLVPADGRGVRGDHGCQAALDEGVHAVASERAAWDEQTVLWREQRRQGRLPAPPQGPEETTGADVARGVEEDPSRCLRCRATLAACSRLEFYVRRGCAEARATQTGAVSTEGERQV